MDFLHRMSQVDLTYHIHTAQRMTSRKESLAINGALSYLYKVRFSQK